MSKPEAIDTRRLQDWIARRFGLHFDDDKEPFLSGLLSRRALETGMPPAAYLDRLDTSAGALESKTLATELTVPETYFFRHVEQLNALAKVVGPHVARARAAGRPLRILSAGCASGEEPYSLAMWLRDNVVERDVVLEIHAIDLNTDMIAKARRGVYSSWSLRETPVNLRRRWFHMHGTNYVLHESIRTAVEFHESNLAEAQQWRFGCEYFDVIFCRNCLMYFTRPQAAAVIGRFTHSLQPAGLLFLGHAETMRGLSDQYRLLQAQDSFYYQRDDDARATPPSGALPIMEFYNDPSNTAWFDSVQRSAARIQALLQPQRPVTRAPTPGPAVARAAAGADLLLQRARQHLADEQFQAGLNLLEELAPEARGAAEARLLQAALFAQSGALSEAERVSRELLMADACNAGAHYMLALCRENARDLQGAIHHDRMAVGLDPKFAMPRLHLGLIARRSGDGDGARRELQLALGLLKSEAPERLRLFGGGFEREALLDLCKAELRAVGGSVR